METVHKPLFVISDAHPGGQEVDGAKELLDALVRDKRFVRCLQKKLFIYGVGRAPLSAETRKMKRVLEDDPTLVDLVMGVVASDGFRLRPSSPVQTRPPK